MIDGSGALGARGDVCIRGNRIVAVGAADGDARRTIDADGAAVAPGFVDIHTHYDAQVFWDPTLSPSSCHGVTTIVGGNCGFSIAPLNGRREDAEYLMRMLARGRDAAREPANPGTILRSGRDTKTVTIPARAGAAA